MSGGSIADQRSRFQQQLVRVLGVLKGIGSLTFFGSLGQLIAEPPSILVNQRHFAPVCGLLPV